MLMASHIPYRRQRDGKSEGRDVRQHALAKIVRFIPVSLIARQIVGSCRASSGWACLPNSPADRAGEPRCAAGI